MMTSWEFLVDCHTNNSSEQMWEEKYDSSHLVDDFEPTQNSKDECADFNETDPVEHTVHLKKVLSQYLMRHRGIPYQFTLVPRWA